MSDQPPDCELHRDSLLLWAKCQMPDWLRGKLDPADLVQQTLLEAHVARAKFAALTELELLAYLRRMLANNLIDAIRKYAPAQAEVSPDVLAASSVRMADWVEANHTSPSERASRNELFTRLAAALAELPDAQRIAVEMHYLMRMKVGEIAAALGRTTGAVEQLLHRATIKLARVLPNPNN